MSETFDLIVIGGGVMGLSTAYSASKSGKKVLVLEQFHFDAQKGSSSGSSRQFRLMHAEINQGKLSIKTKQLWDDLAVEAKSVDPNQILLHEHDELWFGNNEPDVEGPEGNFLKTVEVCETLKVDIEKIDSSVLENKYNFKNLGYDYIGLNGLARTSQPGYVAGAGNINVPFVVKTLHTLSEKIKLVTFVENEPVVEIHPGDTVTVKGKSGKEYKGSKLVIAAGSWTNHLVSHFGFTFNIDIWQMVSCYFKVLDNSVKHPMWISFSYPEPGSIWGEDPNGKTGVGFYYGFPESDWEKPGYIRVCPTVALDVMKDANDASYQPRPDEVAATEKWVSEHIKGVAPKAEHLSTCLTTITQDGDFICGLVPEHKNIAVFTAGWGMKFVPMFGKILSDLVFGAELDEEIKEVLYAFRLDRPNLIVKGTERHARLHAQAHHQRAPQTLRNIAKY